MRFSRQGKDMPSARSPTSLLLFALIVALPPRTAALRSDNFGDLDISPAAAMVPAVARMVTMKMDKGQTMSVGFEFECANKEFTLNHTGECPQISFPLAGVHEREAWMPLKVKRKQLNMANWPKMPNCVKDVIWSYDTLSGNASDGRCNYHLEFKTQPLRNEAQLKEAMVGAAIALREASKRTGPDGWNTARLFDMKKTSDICRGSTHVTKAFVVNKKSLLDMLTQQMYMFCVKGTRKQTAGSDYVFRTSFVQAYMVWRAKRHCKLEEERKAKSQEKLTPTQIIMKQRNEMMHGTPLEQCNKALTLSKMCIQYWDTPEAGEADVRKHLFDGLPSSLLTEVEEDHRKCTPGNALALTCAELAKKTHWDLEDGDGFGNKKAGCYYGPGGVKGKDTTTHLGTALSGDYNIIYAFAEHRKELWNTQHFRTCLYADLFGKKTERNHESNPQDSCTAVSHILDQSRTCRQALGKVMEVEYAEYSDDMPEKPAEVVIMPEQPTEAATTPEQSTETATTPEQSMNAVTTPEMSAVAATTPEQPTDAATTPEQSTEAATTPEQSTKAITTPEKPAVVATTPEQPTEAATTPEQSTQAATTLEQSTKAATTPEKPAEVVIMPEQPTEAATTPEQSTEAATTPEQATKAVTTPEKPTVVATTPEQSTEAATTPEQSTEAATTLKQSTKAVTTPEKPAVVATTPEQSTEAATTPEQATEAATTLKQSTKAVTTPQKPTVIATTPEQPSEAAATTAEQLTKAATTPMQPTFGPTTRKNGAADNSAGSLLTTVLSLAVYFLH